MVLPSITMGSARVAVKVSPVFALLVESVVSVRILIGVPAAMVTGSGLGGGASTFAGAASATALESVAADGCVVWLHPASSSNNM